MADNMKNPTENQNKLHADQLLAEGKVVQINPQGYSMYPLFVPGRDSAVIAPIDRKLKRGDVVLFRRDGDLLVLHRLARHKSDGYYMVGDNQKELEGPLREDQMKGILVRVIRKGKSFSVKNPVYVLLSRIWLFLRPVRLCITKPLAAIKRLFGKKNK